jgi:hypothetical protein
MPCFARKAGASGRRFPTSQTPAAERLQASAEAARVLSSDRRNRSKPAARGGPILASHTAASRLMQESGGAGDAAALVLAVQAFVANGGGRPAGCCIAGADGQSWPCRSAWLVTLHSAMAPGRADTPASGKLLATARQAFADGDCRSHVDAVVWATLSALKADILTSSHLPERCWIPGGEAAVRRVDASVTQRALSLGRSRRAHWSRASGVSRSGRGGACVRCVVVLSS